MTSAVDRAVEPVCGWELEKKAVKLTLRWFGLVCVCVWLHVCEKRDCLYSVYLH